MSNFNKFVAAVAAQAVAMQQTGMLFISKADPNDLYDTYLNSFPAGTNNMYREKTEHDCTACKQFIRAAGGLLSVVDGRLVSVWDVTIVDPSYAAVAKAMSKLAKQSGVNSIFLSEFVKVGIEKNHEVKDGSAREWHHFHCVLDKKFVQRKDKIPALMGEFRETANVLRRSLTEITKDAVDTVLELIAQNSLYRGEEHKRTVTTLKTMLTEFSKVDDKEAYVLSKAHAMGGVARIRNTVIGTLLTDLSEGMELEAAVRSFEQKVAPQNYRRPTALITKSMISNAEAKVEELGIARSLQRRFATLNDITINNVLFADRSLKKSKGVFDDLSAEVATSKPNLDKVEEISIENFLEKVLPSATTIELYVENKQRNNFVSLIAPVDKDAPNILKWDNNFSWSYNGEVTDSIKERVKAAGGNVEGELRVSLSWYNYDDLDLHLIEPNGNEIYFGDRTSYKTGGKLDVDMNAGGRKDSREPVENIFWQNCQKMLEGEYRVVVHNWSKQENVDLGYAVEIDYRGDSQVFEMPAIPNGRRDTVFTFNYSKKDGVVVNGKSGAKKSGKVVEIWGVNTCNFHKVDAIMLSPNHWDEQQVGNKHVFFMLNGCVNPDETRGFYNEFLRNELNDHRKVFEVLGSKMKVEQSAQQISGLGFSTTKRDEVVVRVTGKFSRLLKIKF